MTCSLIYYAYRKLKNISVSILAYICKICPRLYLKDLITITF